MPNSCARARARAGSGSHTATTRARGLTLRQATRWYQLIIPAPASATRMGAGRRAWIVVMSVSEAEEPERVVPQDPLAVARARQPPPERGERPVQIRMPG